jgi:hypothetical protein
MRRTCSELQTVLCDEDDQWAVNDSWHRRIRLRLLGGFDHSEVRDFNARVDT